MTTHRQRHFTDQQIQTLKTTILREYNEDQVCYFLNVCESTGLDPFRRQITPIARRNKQKQVIGIAVFTSIDGLRAIAERTGNYAGQIGPEWCGADGKWKDVWFEGSNPKAARVGVMHKRFKQPLWGTATWAEHGGQSPIWRQMPAHMLGVRAEASALRRAFPTELAGLYTEEEIGPESNSPSNDEQGIVASGEAPPQVDMKDKARAALASKGYDIGTGSDIVLTFTDDEVNGWLMPALDKAGLVLTQLRTDMKKMPQVIDKEVVEMDPTMWPRSLRGRIEKWIEKNGAKDEKESK